MEPSDIASVDWISYGRARTSATEIPLSFTTKLLIGWLPTRTRVAKYDPAITIHCHACQVPETADHPWKCTAATAWKHQFVKHLSECLKSLRTDAMLHDALLITLRAALEINNAHPHPWYSYHPDLLLAGLIPRELTAHQSWAYSTSTPPKHCKNGEQWATRVIKCIWSNLRARWRDRCSKVHDQSPDGSDISRELTISQAKQLLSRKKFVNPVDHHWFPEDETDFLEQSTETLDTWLLVASPAIEACIHRENARRKATQHPITRFFNRQPP